jgi:hypothetical protein
LIVASADPGMTFPESGREQVRDPGFAARWIRRIDAKQVDEQGRGGIAGTALLGRSIRPDDARGGGRRRSEPERRSA